MLTTAAILSLTILVAANDKLYTRIEGRLNQITRANNVSDDKIIIRELHTFINDNGLRRENVTEKPSLREEDKNTPELKRLRAKILDLMRQAVYGTQDRLMELTPILQKYKDDPALRMSFIYNRLEQLILDMKRIYTLAHRWKLKKRVYEQTIWYENCARKYIDILYTVEYAIQLHVKYLKQFGGEEAEYGYVVTPEG